MGKAPGAMNTFVCLTLIKHLFVSINVGQWSLGKLTGLNAGRDSQQRHDEAQATVDTQEELVEEAGLCVRVENDHKHQGSHCHGEQHQCDQSQRCIPDFIILDSWAPVEGHSGDGSKECSGFNTTSAFKTWCQLPQEIILSLCPPKNAVVRKHLNTQGDRKII